MASAALFGTAIVTVAVLGVDILRYGFLPPASARPGNASPAAAALLVAGTFGGFALAWAFAFWLLAPIVSLYRRTALAIVSSFATVILMLAAVPIHERFRQRGLVGLAALLAGGALWLAVRARRAARSS